MNKPWIYISLYLFSVFIASVAQVLLKQSALESHSSSLSEYLNVKVVTAYSIFFLSTALTMIAYRGIDLSFGPLLEASGFLFILGLSSYFLNEKIKRSQLFGLLCILFGILLYIL